MGGGTEVMFLRLALKEKEGAKSTPEGGVETKAKQTPADMTSMTEALFVKWDLSQVESLFSSLFCLVPFLCWVLRVLLGKLLKVGKVLGTHNTRKL